MIFWRIVDRWQHIFDSKSKTNSSKAISVKAVLSGQGVRGRLEARDFGGQLIPFTYLLISSVIGQTIDLQRLKVSYYICMRSSLFIYFSKFFFNLLCFFYLYHDWGNSTYTCINITGIFCKSNLFVLLIQLLIPNL